MKTSRKDIDGIKGGDRDTKGIPGRKVKERDKRESIELGQHGLEENTKIDCDQFLKWTMKKEDVKYAYWKMKQQVIRERMLAEEGSKRNDGDIMSYVEQKRGEHEVDWEEDGNVNCNQQSKKEQLVPQDMRK